MSTAPDSALQDVTDYYLRLLHAGDFDAAFHGLTEQHSAIVHPLITAYHAEKSPAIRAELLRIISEFRTSCSLPLFREALRDRRDDCWKAALDCLVALASTEAVQTLESVLRDESLASNPDDEYIAWVREALEQAQQSHLANSGSGHVSHSVSGALRTFSFWIANRTVGLPLLEGVDYSCIFNEPSALEMTYAIFINVLEFDGTGQVVNAKYAERRAAQYILEYVTGAEVQPPFEQWEVSLYEPPPRIDLKQPQ